MKHLLTLWMLALCLCVSAKETCPKVIPALQEWKGGSGKLVLPAEGSIVVAPADEAALKSVATVLAQDLKDLLDWNYTIRTGKPGKNDIYLSLMKPDKQLGKEGYVLTAGRYAGIEAPARPPRRGDPPRPHRGPAARGQRGAARAGRNHSRPARDALRPRHDPGLPLEMGLLLGPQRPFAQLIYDAAP